MERAEHCQTCGLTEREFHEDPEAYSATQVVCPWCAMRDRARSSSDTDVSVPGASVKMLPKHVADRIISAKPVRPKSKRERARDGT